MTSKTYKKKAGEIIKKYRIEKGLSQQEIANQLGKDRSTYTYYELGKVSIDIDTFIAIYNILNINPNEIIKEILK